MSWRDRPVVVAGAGSIGCFVGGLLAAAGRQTVFLGRGPLAEAARTGGLHLTAHTGQDITLDPARVRFRTDPACLADAGLILVTVKSAQTPQMADLIAVHAPPDSPVLSLQNGIDNPSILRRMLPKSRIVGGMVPFNVVRLGDTGFHRGSSGPVVIEAGIEGLRDLLSVPGLTVRETADFAPVQWGKLLLNLNNALNALSDLPLRDELRLHAWRRRLADQIDEALRVLDAAGIKAASTTILPMRLLPAVLRTPDWLFPILAAPALRIDAKARSSMWEDLQRGRPTEIDELQGRVIALADAHGIAVPMLREVVARVRSKEASS